MKQMRESTGVKQVSVSEMLGVTQGAISQWETGETRPDIKHIQELARIYGVTSDVILSAISASAKA